MRFYLFLIILCTYWSSCSKNPGHTEETASFNVHYGEQTANLLDIYNMSDNRSSLKPVALFVHGGGWHSYNKTTFWASTHISFFNEIGFIALSMDYRLSPFPFELNNPDRIMHPAHVNDVARAIKWIKENARKFGGDPDNIYIIGHSAGALLVSIVATNERFLNALDLDLSAIKGVVSLDGGPYLTADPAWLAMQQGPQADPYLLDLRDAYLNAFGTDPIQHDDANPIKHIEAEKHIPPFLLVYTDMPYRQQPNEIFAKLLRENGHEVFTHVAPRYTHTLVWDCLGTSYDYLRISDVVASFLQHGKIN